MQSSSVSFVPCIVPERRADMGFLFSQKQSPGAEGGASGGRQEGQGLCEEEDGAEEDCSEHDHGQ